MTLKSSGLISLGLAATALIVSACASQPATTTSSAIYVPSLATPPSEDPDAAQATLTTALDAAATTRGPGEPALWRIVDSDTTIHLFGTFGPLPPNGEWRSQSFDDAFTASDTIIFETDTLSAASQAAYERLTAKEGLFTDGRLLSTVIDDALKMRLRRATANVEIPYAALESFKPWLAARLIQITLAQSSGFGDPADTEQLLTNEGEIGGKTFVYLDTTDDQLGAVSDLALEDQVDLLAIAAISAEVGPDLLANQFTEWADGDLAGLQAIAANPFMLGGTAAYQAQIVDRSRAWLPKIKMLLQEPGTKFVAVGIEHLIGPANLIALLEAEGVEVTGP
ncbi:MAG: TraB/GumN family protein [Pseudomonadota bacterium]